MADKIIPITHLQNILTTRKNINIPFITLLNNIDPISDIKINSNQTTFARDSIMALALKENLSTYQEIIKTKQPVNIMRFGKIVDVISKVLYIQSKYKNQIIDKLTELINPVIGLDTLTDQLLIEKINQLNNILLNENSLITTIIEESYFLVMIDDLIKGETPVSTFINNMNFDNGSLDYKPKAIIKNLTTNYPAVVRLIIMLSKNVETELNIRSQDFKINSLVKYDVDESIIVLGEMDFDSNNEIVDVKVSKYEPNKNQLIQLALYYIFNQNKNIKRLTIYNPLLNKSLSIETKDIVVDDNLNELINFLKQV